MFDYFDWLDKKENKLDYDTHPHPKQRVFFLLLGIQEAKYENNEIFDLSLEELESMSEEYTKKFIDKYYEDEKISGLLVNTYKLLEAYEYFIKEKKI